jgi:hypothetical protein
MRAMDRCWGTPDRLWSSKPMPGRVRGAERDA